MAHCGRRAVSATSERVTMVTSYVPGDPLLPDRSVLRGPRPVSDRSLLYAQWAKYRLASVQAQVCCCPCSLPKQPCDLTRLKAKAEVVQDTLAPTICLARLHTGWCRPKKNSGMGQLSYVSLPAEAVRQNF